MLVNYGEKRVSKLISPVFSPERFLQKSFNVRQLVTAGALQNSLNMLVREQQPSAEVGDMCVWEFGDRLLIAPVIKIQLKLPANFIHLEPFNL